MNIFQDLTAVIPVYNRAAEIVRCLDSVAAQTVRPGRVIVVDDGSTDGSADAARQHPLHPEVLAGHHAGAAAARNVGLDAVTTCWTMFFDSDDIMLPGHIAMAQSGVTDDVDVVGWKVLACGPDGWKKVLPFELRNILWHNMMHGTMATQRYMARTELFRRAGGWNVDMRIWLDIELGTRLLALHPHIVKVAAEAPTVHQMVGDKSITGSSWMGRVDRCTDALDRISRSMGPSYDTIVAVKRAILAADVARENRDVGRAIYRGLSHRPFAARFAYRYRLAGGRGAARIISPFVNKNPKL